MRRSRSNRRGLVLAGICVLAMACAAQAVLPDGLVAYYKLNATAGLTAIDETGAHDGTLTGSLAWVPGKDGNGLQFIGGTGSPFVNLGAWQTDGPAGLALALWVKWDGVSDTYQGLLSQRDGTMYWWTEMTPDAGQLRFKSNTSPQSNLYLTGEHLIEGEWTHYACSHDAAAGTGAVYLNGEEALTGSWSLPDIDASGLRTGIGVVNVADGLGTFNGVIDEVMIFDRPVSIEELAGAMSGFSDPTASAPKPAAGTVDVPRDVVLSWRPGQTAIAHDVYFGTVFEDVSMADRSNPMGVLQSQAQDANAYEPAELLAYGQTYHWRVDEVNAAPGNEIFKGDVWNFTVEPYAYPIEGIIASTNATPQAGAVIENTVNGSGLNANDEHSTLGDDMWLGVGPADESLVVQYEFDRIYMLDEMWVWNYNVQFEPVLGFGLKDVTIDYSADGAEWTTLGDFEFAKAPGLTTYTPNTMIDMTKVAAKFVRLTVNSGWGVLGQYGLSEVRFFQVPVVARDPEPAAGEADLNPEIVLSWRGGRTAASHDLYFGTDQDAVATGAALLDTLAENEYDLGALDLGTTYYWKVDEVNEADTPAIWEGDLWSFTTQEYFTIEDFVSYTDDLDAGEAIFQTWIDGWETGNGSTVGYFDAPFAEQTIFYSTAQSMPLAYNNTEPPFYSEAERTFDSPQDWTINGADTLVLHIQGGTPGVVELADGGMLIGAIGSDIWNNADQCRFVYKNLAGNGSMIARVDYLDNGPSTWVKAGVMIRQNTEAGAVNTFIAMTGGDGGGATFQQRVDADGATVSQHTYDGNPFAPPYWVKLERTGSTFEAFISPDGETWQKAGDTATVAMSDPVLVGLAVTSHNAAQATVAEFSNISFTGNVTGQWASEGIGAEQPAGNTPDTLYVALEDTSGHVKAVANDNPNAVVTPAWQEWLIPLSDFSSAGVRINSIEKMYIGVGDRDNPVAGGQGLIYIDDIGFGHPVSDQ